MERGGSTEAAMKQAHLTAEELEGYRKRTLTPDARRRFDRHVASCEECIGRIFDTELHVQLAVSQLTEAFLTSDEEPCHLTREEFNGYATGLLDEADRTIVDSHLEICPQCSRVAEAAPAIRPDRPPVITSPSFWQRISESWRLPSFATAMICLTGCLLLVWSLRHRPTGVSNHETSDPASATGKESTRLQADETHTAAPPESTPKHSSPPDGTRVNPPSDEPASANAAILVRLRDGGREIRLDEEGKLIGLEDLAQEAQRDVKAALTTRELRKPRVLLGLTGPPIRLLDSSTNGVGFKLISPIGTAVARQRPTLRWEPLRGAASYTISVFDSRFHRVAQSEPQSTTEWLMPIPLRRGDAYSWEVTALRDNLEISAPVAPAPRAQFRILETERVSELNRIRKQGHGSHLAMGVSYARMGLLDDAERELLALAKDNPQSRVAKQLVRTVQAWRRR